MPSWRNHRWTADDIGTGVAFSAGTYIFLGFLIHFLNRGNLNMANASLNQVSYKEKEITIPKIDKSFTIKWPNHYVIFTGFTSAQGYYETIDNGCGDVKKILYVTYDWNNLHTWDLSFSRTTKEIYFSKDMGFNGFDVDLSAYDNPEVEWKYLGRISKNAEDPNWIQERAQEVVNEMNGEYQGVLKRGGGYREYFNNCRNFKSYLYQKIKD